MRGLGRKLRTLAWHLFVLCLAAFFLAPVLGLVAGAFGPDESAPFEPLHDLLQRTDGNGFSLLGIAISNSLRVSVVVSLVCLLLAPPAGYALSRTKFPGRKVILTAFVSVLIAPITLLLVPMEIVLGTVGLHDTHLGLILGELSLAMPLAAWLMKRAFDRMPPELEEAARLEGATGSQIFWQVALPFVRGSVFVVFLISFAMSWGEYLFATTLITKAPLLTLAGDIVDAAKPSLSPWERFAPAALVATLPAVVLMLLAQRRFGDFIPSDVLSPKPRVEE